MLERTFVHIPKIGYLTERRLWELGVLGWPQACSCSAPPRGFSRHRWEEVQDYCEQSRQHLEADLAARDHWRAWPDFKHRCAYLDIETTGLGYWAEVTMVGVYDGSHVHTYIAGQNLEQLAEDLQQYALLVTFNGATFDLPFLRRRFRDLPFDQLHIDLRYPLGRLGYSGGLKSIERRLGLQRDDDIAGLNGFDAVRLWEEYQAGSEESLELLVKYNTADIENLETLMDLGYRQTWRRLADTQPDRHSSER